MSRAAAFGELASGLGRIFTSGSRAERAVVSEARVATHAETAAAQSAAAERAAARAESAEARTAQSHARDLERRPRVQLTKGAVVGTAAVGAGVYAFSNPDSFFDQLDIVADRAGGSIGSAATRACERVTGQPGCHIDAMPNLLGDGISKLSGWLETGAIFIGVIVVGGIALKVYETVGNRPALNIAA